jgi:hypothetical protein
VARGGRGIDDVPGSRTSCSQWRPGLGEDDSAAGLGMARLGSIAGLGTAWGAQRHGLGEDNIFAGSRTTSQAWRWHHRLGSGKMAMRKGARPWTGTTAWRFRGGLDDGMEASGRTQRWNGLRGGRQQHRL